MDTSVKNTLISFYYLLEIIKLRKVSVNIDMNLTKANNLIKHYNNVIKPYIPLYNKSMKEQEKKSLSLKLKPLSFNYKKFAEAMNLNYDDIKDKSVNELIAIMTKTFAKRKQRKIADKKQGVIKPIVKF